MYNIEKMQVKNSQKVINSIRTNSEIDHYVSQINVINRSIFKEFMKFCNKLAEKQIIDELGGIPEGETKREFIRRYPINIPFETVIENAETGTVCGIKIVPNPTIKMNDYENWDGGYIEAFIRMNGNEDYVDWFVWQYIKIKHLKTILNKFKDNLIILKI